MAHMMRELSLSTATLRRALSREAQAGREFVETPNYGDQPVNDVIRILSSIEHGDPKAAEQLLPLVYDELRTLAARRLAGEKPGQTQFPLPGSGLSVLSALIVDLGARNVAA
jgi:hypothetical protein